MKFDIRPLKESIEFRHCERVQQAIWGSVSVAAEVMIVTQKFGGMVLGAFADRKLVGFIYAFLGRREGQLIHWSHMMGLLPELRDKGLGLRMKLAHREFALRQGIKAICWTFDPLQSRNASLNLVKLGARVEQYIVDCYGDFPSIIERGVPSDRLVVKWRITTKSVARRLAGQRPRPANLSWPRVNATRVNKRGMIENRDIDFRRRESKLLLEIPANTDEMRKKAITLAKRWRLETREIFLCYFSQGYRVNGFLTVRDSSCDRCYYVFQRQDS